MPKAGNSHMPTHHNPNILLLFTDQQRFDTIAALGNSIIKTPHLDRLCREGTAFTSAYSPCPVCVPARCAMHYGQYPAHTGCADNGDPFPDDRPSHVELLRRAGFRTHAIGKRHFMPDHNATRGFETLERQEEMIHSPEEDEYRRYLNDHGYAWLASPHGLRSEMYYVPQPSVLPAEHHPTQWVGDRSCAFIENEAHADRPWYLYSSFIHPHPPFAPPSPWHLLYRAKDMPLPFLPETSEAMMTWINREQNRYKYRDRGLDMQLLRTIRAYYYACISFIDYQIGSIYEALERSGQLENTLILFASDHGECLGDYQCFGKRSYHDACARVPLLARWPGKFNAGAHCESPASLVDIAATALAAAGVAPTPELPLDGVDLTALARGEAQRDHVSIQFQRGGQALHTIVTEDWKFCWSAGDGKEFLFDRRAATEETNLAEDPAQQQTCQHMREALKTSLRAHGIDDAIDGDHWRTYPPIRLPDAPDAHLLLQDPPNAGIIDPKYM